MQQHPSFRPGADVPVRRAVRTGKGSTGTMSYFADYHTHSACSPDAHTPMGDMAAAAVAAGLNELCFTDHVEPVEWGSARLRRSYDWEALERAYREACFAWGDRIRLRLGIELGDALRNRTVSEQLLAAAPALDFVIGSIHALPAAYDWVDLYFYDYEKQEAIHQALRAYLDEVLALARWGNFSVLGHLTLPVRYANEIHGLHLSFDGFEEEIRVIFRVLVQGGLGIELNTNRGHTPLPDEKWLRMYREEGGEIITIGSDAHTPQYVGCDIREKQELLRDCGFTRFCTFEQRRPVWHRL